MKFCGWYLFQSIMEILYDKCTHCQIFKFDFGEHKYKSTSNF